MCDGGVQKKKGFFAKLFEKFDKKMKDKADGGCCCCGGDSAHQTECKSEEKKPEA